MILTFQTTFSSFFPSSEFAIDRNALPVDGVVSLVHKFLRRRELYVLHEIERFLVFLSVRTLVAAPDRVDIHHEPAGPACPRCNKSTERNTQVFKSLGLNAVRCMTCKMAAVEGDSDQFYFDLKSAAAGLLLKRALVVFELKHPTYPVPAVKSDAFFEIIASDAGDPRWNE
jgi:hypothetical protein